MNHINFKMKINELLALASYFYIGKMYHDANNLSKKEILQLISMPKYKAALLIYSILYKKYHIALNNDYDKQKMSYVILNKNWSFILKDDNSFAKNNNKNNKIFSSFEEAIDYIDKYLDKKNEI